MINPLDNLSGDVNTLMGYDAFNWDCVAGIDQCARDVQDAYGQVTSQLGEGMEKSVSSLSAIQQAIASPLTSALTEVGAKVSELDSSIKQNIAGQMGAIESSLGDICGVRDTWITFRGVGTDRVTYTFTPQPDSYDPALSIGPYSWFALSTYQTNLPIPSAMTTQYFRENIRRIAADMEQWYSALCTYVPAEPTRPEANEPTTPPIETGLPPADTPTTTTPIGWVPAHICLWFRGYYWAGQEFPTNPFYIPLTIEGVYPPTFTPLVYSGEMPLPSGGIVKVRISVDPFNPKPTDLLEWSISGGLNPGNGYASVSVLGSDPITLEGAGVANGFFGELPFTWQTTPCLGIPESPPPPVVEQPKEPPIEWPDNPPPEVGCCIDYRPTIKACCQSLSAAIRYLADALRPPVVDDEDINIDIDADPDDCQEINVDAYGTTRCAETDMERYLRREGVPNNRPVPKSMGAVVEGLNNELQRPEGGDSAYGI